MYELKTIGKIFTGTSVWDRTLVLRKEIYRNPVSTNSTHGMYCTILHKVIVLCLCCSVPADYLRCTNTQPVCTCYQLNCAEFVCRCVHCNESNSYLYLQFKPPADK